MKAATKQFSAVFVPFLIFSFLSFPHSAFASDWDIGYNYLSQVRKGPPGQSNQVPIYQYLHFDMSQFPDDISFQTDFQVFGDPNTASSSFSLYQADFHIEPVKGFMVNAGRIFLMDGFENNLLNGARFAFEPSEFHLGGSFYAGTSPFEEQGSFKNNTQGLLVGGSLDLKNVKDTTGSFSAKWQKLNVRGSSFRANDTIYLGLAGSRQFSKAGWAPKVYVDVEGDVGGKVLDVATLGFELYPHWRVALNLEGNRFDVGRNSNERTVFGDYLRGAILQGREALQLKLLKGLNFVENFSYMHYNARGSNGKNSYTLSSGLDTYWERPKLSTYAEFYYTKSYGGTVYGGYLDLIYNYFKNVFADVSLDISNYSKITGQASQATSFVGDVGYKFAKRCSFALGLEVNRNDWYDHEERITIDFRLDFGKGDYAPEKRSKRVNRKFHEI